MTEVLKDRVGCKIGEIKDEGSDRVVYDRSGRRLGHYDGTYTYDRLGRRFGTGNLLAVFLFIRQS